MGELWIMFQKELMDVLRDRRLLTAIVLPLILIPLLFGMLQSSGHSTKVAVRVIDNDGGEYSKALMAFLERNGISVDESSPVTLVIPAGFSDTIKKGGSPGVLIKTQLSSPLDFKAVRFAEVLKGLILRFGNGILPSIKPRFLMNVGGDTLNVEPSKYLSSLLKSSLTVPLVLFVIAIYASQAIAASVAMEKEGKTLETLLTLPVSRRSIILGKISASITFSLLVLASLALSFGAVSLFSGRSDGHGAGVSVGVAPLLFLSAGIFFLFILMLLTSLLVSLFTLDVRSALSIAGLVEVLYLIPFMVLFAGLNLSGAAGLLVKIDPGYAPILAFLEAINGSYVTAIGALLYLLVWNAVILRLTIWIFDSGILVSTNINMEKLRWLVRIKI